MKKLWIVVGMALVGCGAEQNWSGTYSGPVRRAATAQGLETGTSAEETWTVTERSYENITVVRARQGEVTCELHGVHGGQAGGYSMTLTAGTTCTIDGAQRILQFGDLTSDSRAEYLIELRWGESAEAITLHERGVLQRN